MFRKAWIEAAEETKIKIKLIRRDDGKLMLFFKVLFNRFKGSKLGTFGVSESLFLCILKPDLLLFSGLGRLLDKDSRLRKILFNLLLTTCRHSIIVCLNNDDYRILNAIGFTRVYRINGEGYIKKPAGEKPIIKKGDFLFIGRLLKSKGLVQILESFLKSKFTNCNLYVVGDQDFGNSDSLSQQQINFYQKKSNNHIHFCGFKSDLSRFYTPDAIYVSASKREGMPFSVLEALDNNMMCFLSRVPGHKDLANFTKVKLFKDSDELTKLMTASKHNINNLVTSKPQLNIYSKESVKLQIKNIYKEMLYA